MFGKREVRALEVAVCRFLINLDATLAEKVTGWRTACGHGFRFKKVRGSEGKESVLDIWPAGWPKGSTVRVRFIPPLATSGTYRPTGGMVQFLYRDDRLGQVNFLADERDIRLSFYPCVPFPDI